MGNRLKTIKILLALAAIIAMIVYYKTPNANKSLTNTIDRHEDMEAICAIVVMSVY